MSTRLPKAALSQYLRTRCDRMLACSINTTNASTDTLLPLTARPGLLAFRERGKEFESELLGELEGLFPQQFVRVTKRTSPRQAADLAFKRMLEEHHANNSGDSLVFFSEPSLAQERFRIPLLNALGVDASNYPAMPDLRPDLVILMPGEWLTDGASEILTDGSVRPVAKGAPRTALRVVDLKFAEQLNVAYAGEVCLYAMVLAAWLAHPEIALSDRYYVDAAPGVLVRHSDRASNMPMASAPTQERLKWFEAQIDAADAVLYAPPVVRFFREDLKRVLDGMHDWRSLGWHVSPTCAFCDYLGYPGWSKRAITEVQTNWRTLRPAVPVPNLDDYCHEDARRNQRLNHVPNLTRGMLRSLERGAVAGLLDLRQRVQGDKVFDLHNGLRAEAARLPRKAGAILDEQSAAHPLAMSAGLARYTDLLVSIVCYFDAATGLLTSFGMGVDYRSPAPYGSALPRCERKAQLGWVVEDATPECEGRHLLDCLRYLSQFTSFVLSARAAPESIADPSAWVRYCQANARIQVVFWDARQDEAFRRALGRHLHEIAHAKDLERALLWLFPPQEIEPSDRTATTLAVCHLHETVTRLVALPTVINDDLLSVAKHLADFEVRATPYMWDRVAGVIPKERSLEITQRMPPKNPPASISQCVDQLGDMVKDLVHALRQCVFAVQRLFKEQLKGLPPKIADLPPTRFARVAADARLWLTHEGLNEGVAELERSRSYLAEPHELESRYEALRLHGLVQGQERARTLNEWRAQGVDRLPTQLRDSHFLFRVRESSRYVKFRNDTDFLVLLPEHPRGAGLMDVAGLCDSMELPTPDPSPGWDPKHNFAKLQRFTGAKLVHFDRESLQALVAFEFAPNFQKVSLLVSSGIIDLSAPMMLVEGLSPSFFAPLQQIARAIGNPRIAGPAPHTLTALLTSKTKPGSDPEHPAAHVLWSAERLVAAPTNASLARFEETVDMLTALAAPERLKVELDSSQRTAIKKVLSQRLMPVWGGPGTGKTQTLAASIMAEMLLRLDVAPRQRIYVTGPTYRAVLEVAERLARFLRYLPSALIDRLGRNLTVSFVASQSRARAWDVLLDDAQRRYCGVKTELYLGRERVVDGQGGAGGLFSLRERLLHESHGIDLVFGVTKSSFWLGKGGRENLNNDDISPLVALFDRIFIDESSQVSVAEALPTLALLADDGRLGLFGDPLQMPPIQSIEPPLGAEHMVGSLHGYLTKRFPEVQREEAFLQYNYRSCEPIVRYARMIGYKAEFTARFPDKALVYQACPKKPGDWTHALLWLAIYNRILDPGRPIVAVTYNDGASGQANPFEATLVAGTVLAYRSAHKTRLGEEFDERTFWTDQIGVVTPHRAQRSAIVERLRAALTGERVPAHLIDESVDTVERFQGGERELVLISFGVGDPDLVRSEEQFLFQRERINVAVSRARSKAVLFVSKDLVFHLPEDKDVVAASRAIKGFAYQLANRSDAPEEIVVDGQLWEVETRYANYES